MKIVKLPNGVLSVNTYFLINEDTKECIVIDCGENYQLINSKKDELGVKIKAVLLTHAHFDHVGCANRFMDDGIPVYISDVDAPKLETDDNLGRSFRRSYVNFKADKTFKDGDELNICGINLKVMLTPGHTDGSVCFFAEDNIIFSGDTLFYESIGRTDFPTGDYNAIEKSLQRLYALDGDYVVYPGHGEDTTLSHERIYNMFIRKNG